MTNSPDSPSTPTVSSVNLANRLRNLLIVLVAIALSTALFWGLRTEATTPSLGAMAEMAVPLEVAVTNGKPTLMEFYADWCTTCQAMADDMQTLKQEYGDRVNFVMLNVDNSKWLPEMTQYRVDGIPHFVFMDQAGQAIANTIGEQPRLIMAANLDALLAGEALPHARTTGQFSSVEVLAVPNANDDPRSHGG